MPRRDGTGPMGQGPKTGRGMGSCANVESPVFGYGRGLGLGKGLGIGCRRFRFFANTTSLSKDDLLFRKQMLKQELDTIDRALNRTAENQ